jgi:hypothetical protein
MAIHLSVLLKCSYTFIYLVHGDIRERGGIPPLPPIFVRQYCYMHG